MLTREIKDVLNVIGNDYFRIRSQRAQRFSDVIAKAVSLASDLSDEGVADVCPVELFRIASQISGFKRSYGDSVRREIMSEYYGTENLSPRKAKSVKTDLDFTQVTLNA